MAVAEVLRATQQIETPVKRVMPLSFVPEASKRFPSPELTSVAGHELNHALVALAHGAPVVSLSVIPQGNSLGRTILGGTVSMETMKVIAAGGGVETHDGCAEGFGSDKYKVDVLHHFHGGHSWESAKNQASSALSVYSREVRKKAAEIVAYLGKVSGSLIGEIMLRAQMEVNEEKHGESEPIVPIFVPQNKSESYTIIDNLPNNSYKITYVVVGKKDEVQHLCGLCHGIDSHMEKCPNADTKKDSRPESLISSKSLAKTGTIFSAAIPPAEPDVKII